MSLPSPAADQAYMNFVSALEAESLRVPLQIVVDGSSPTDAIRNPSPAFLLCRSKGGQCHQVVFDLRIRRDSFLPWSCASKNMIVGEM
ncbi:hypothetical protein F4604DRAFT_1739319 [Suillus subluteus]|nr:hypothetical protein F4604DRAFT_1739319 [Suillus subluteus]